MLRDRGIVMVSLGDRPWAPATAASFAAYAARNGADFVLADRWDPAYTIPEWGEDRGRPNKAAYFYKSLVVWTHLAAFRRLLVVDDTCVARADGDDIFAATPSAVCGYTATSPGHAETSFATIRRFLAARGLPDIAFEPRHYMNSGVMVYDHSMREAFRPELLLAAAELLYDPHPHQTLSYYLIKRAGIASHIVPKAFNAFPGMKLPTAERRGIADVSPHIDMRRTIYHVSAGYRHRQRILADLCRIFAPG